MKPQFPRTNQYFGTIQTRYPDSSHNNSVFRCVASDNFLVVGVIVGTTYKISDPTKQYIFRRTDCEFNTASRQVVGILTRDQDATDHLIAAAPDMLAALDGLVYPEWSHLTPVQQIARWDAARAAIAKAKGQKS